MKILIGSLISSILGATIALTFVEGRIPKSANAQVQQNLPGPILRDGSTRGNVEQQMPNVFDQEGLSPEEAINVAVYENVNRSVVNITTKSSRPDAFFLLAVPSEGTGSGSILDNSGHILTNYHVIEDAREVEVTIFNGNSYTATYVGSDPINDIAVIKIDTPKNLLFPVTLGDSGELRVGMRVFAIGNPFGLERTLTTGIISSLNRSLQIRANRTIKSIIQIDAAINPGNSGGPLLDSHGRVIGINTAIASKTGQSSGVGFAIPVNLVSRVVPQLIQHGKIIRPEIGIQRVYETDQGLLVAKLIPNGAAEQAGLRGPRIVRQRRGPFVIERIDRSAADTIVLVDNIETKTADDFLGYIESKKPGDTIELTVIREGKRLKLTVQLGGDQPANNFRDTKI